MEDKQAGQLGQTNKQNSRTLSQDYPKIKYYYQYSVITLQSFSM